MFPAAIGLAIAVSTLDIVWVRAQLGGAKVTTWWILFAGIAVSGAAGIASWVAARRAFGRVGRGWIFVGAGLFSWTAGQAVRAYYELGRGEHPMKSFADIGFLGMVPLAVIGLLHFPAPPRRMAGQVRAVLDGFIIIGSLLFISWAVLLGPLTTGTVGTLDDWLHVLYPIADVVLVSIVLYVATRIPAGYRWPLALIGVGFTMVGTADSGRLYQQFHGTWTNRSLIDPWLDLGFLLIMLGGIVSLHRRVPRATDAESSPGQFAVLLPYLAVLPVLTLSAYYSRVEPLKPFLFWDMLAVLLLVVGRQLLTLLENVYLRTDLESRVRELMRANAELVEGVSDYAIFALDPQGFVRTWNAGAERIKGHSATDIIGRHFSCFYPPGDVDAGRPAADLRRALTEGRAEQEGWRLRKDGSRFFGNVVITPLRDDEDILRGFSNVTRDITERVRAEQERDELEAQLNHSRRLESLGQLAGGVAHDFNNILAVILGFAGVVKDQVNAQVVGTSDETRAEIVRHLDQIRRAAERAAALTKQLLTFSRRDAIRPQTIDLNHAVHELEMLLRRTLGESVNLELDLATEVWPIKIDPGQLDQVLANLAINARDAMTNGGILTIQTSNEPLDDFGALSHPGLSAGRYVRVRVADTGVGMSEDVAARAFEPFFTTKPKGAGTGLGLATVYGIVRQAAGSIGVRSVPGRGTSFTIHFPVTDDIGAKPEDAPASVSLDPRGETVLVAEDDEAVRQLAVRILSQHGYAVVEAPSPVRAAEMFAEQPEVFDLLLTDIVMPNLSGPELIARVREMRPDIPALCMSGYAEPVVNMAEMGEGVSFISKPFTKEQLLAEVRSALDAHAFGQSTAPSTRPADAPATRRPRSPGKKSAGKRGKDR